jgi:glycosyltransferase involved in cell wall biosynthesis
VGVVPLAATFLEAREYTCPVKLMEMMGAGLAIATARLPSVEEIVRDGVEVAMAPSDDPAAWAATIRRLLEDTENAARLAAAARSKAEAFSYERRARTFLETVEAAERIRNT